MSSFYYSWEHAIMQCDALESVTKYLLLALGYHMSKAGDQCFPKQSTLAQEMKVSRSTVAKHIELAIKAGFLRKQSHGYKGVRHRQLEYEACFPDGSAQNSETNVAQADITNVCENDINREECPPDGHSNVRQLGMHRTDHANKPAISGIGVSGESARDISMPPPADEKLVDDGVGNSSELSPADDPVRSLALAYIQLEQERYGMTHTPIQRDFDGLMRLVQHWLSLDIDPDWLRKCWKRRLGKRYLKDRSPPQLGWWEPVITDEWEMSEDGKKAQSFIQKKASGGMSASQMKPANSAFDASKTEPKLTDAWLDGVSAVPKVNRAAWARHQMMMLREDERWQQLASRFAARFGQAKADAWLGKCAPILIEEDVLILWCPSRYILSHIRDTYLRDLERIAAALCGNACQIRLGC